MNKTQSKTTKNEQMTHKLNKIELNNDSEMLRYRCEGCEFFIMGKCDQWNTTGKRTQPTAFWHIP